MVVLCGRYDSRGGGKIRARNLAPDGAGCDLHLRVTADPFRFSHRAAGHHIEFAVVFSEPDWCGHACAGFAEGYERYVFLTVNRGGNWVAVLNQETPIAP